MKDEEKKLYLKEAILSSFESSQMRKYIREHYDSLQPFEVCRILYGANMPIEAKAELFDQLNMVYPNQRPDDYEAYARMMQSAVQNMKFQESEQAVYLLNISQQKKHSTAEVEHKLFLSFSSAVQFLTDEAKGDMNGNMERYGQSGWYHLIEKWIPEQNGTMKQIFEYLVLPDGTVINAEPCDYGGIGKFDYCDNGANLNLPVPFLPGDIVTLDSRPFGELRHCVIIAIGDNQDCCSVQCLYVDEECSDVSAVIGALKHSPFYGSYIPFSPLYRAEVCFGGLPEEERFMHELSSTVRSLFIEGKRDMELENRICGFLKCFLDAGVARENLAGELRKKMVAEEVHGID